MMQLTAEEHGAMYMRIGMLNLFNPCKCSGHWFVYTNLLFILKLIVIYTFIMIRMLDMTEYEHRRILKMLIHIQLFEKGTL